MSLKAKITEDMKAAMKGGEKDRLAVIRLVQAQIKQREVDERIELDDVQVLAVLEKMQKQRRDSIEQFTKGGRKDLADKETAEIAVLDAYLPPAVDAGELETAVDAAITSTGATSAKDMGRVMKAVMASLAGKNVDGKLVNELVRRKLGA